MHLFLLIISPNFAMGQPGLTKLQSEFRDGSSGSTPDIRVDLLDQTWAELPIYSDEKADGAFAPVQGSHKTLDEQQFSMVTELSKRRAISQLKDTLSEEYARSILKNFGELNFTTLRVTKDLCDWIMHGMLYDGGLSSVNSLVSSRYEQFLNDFTEKIETEYEHWTLGDGFKKDKVLNWLHEQWQVKPTNGIPSKIVRSARRFMKFATHKTLAQKLEIFKRRGADYRLSLDPWVKRELECDEDKKRRTDILLKEEFENMTRAEEIEKKKGQKLETLAVDAVNLFFTAHDNELVDENGKSYSNFRLELDFDIEKDVSPAGLTVEKLNERLQEFAIFKLQNIVKYILAGVLAEHKSEFFYLDHDPITNIASAIMDRTKFQNPKFTYILSRMKSLYAKGKIAALLHQVDEVSVKPAFEDTFYEDMLIFTDTHTLPLSSLMESEMETLALEKAHLLFPSLFQKAIRNSFTTKVIKAMELIHVYDLKNKENPRHLESSDLELAKTAAKSLCLLRFWELDRFRHLYEMRLQLDDTVATTGEKDPMGCIKALQESLNAGYYSF